MGIIMRAGRFILFWLLVPVWLVTLFGIGFIVYGAYFTITTDMETGFDWQDALIILVIIAGFVWSNRCLLAYSRVQKKRWSRGIGMVHSKDALSVRSIFGRLTVGLLVAGIALPFLYDLKAWEAGVDWLSRRLWFWAFLSGVAWMVVPEVYLRSELFRKIWRFGREAVRLVPWRWLGQTRVAVGIVLLLAVFVSGRYVEGLREKSRETQSRLAAAEKQIELIEGKLGGADKIGCSGEKSAEKVMRSVVRIVGGESEGSGFAIQYGGLVLTNFHVIEFESNPKVVLPDNTFSTGQVIMADKNADLAIISIDKDLPVVPWGNPREMNPAEELLAIGYSLGGQLSGAASVSKGSLSGMRRSKDVGLDYIQTDITLNHGQSGGPMINVCGEVVGVNTAGLAGLGMAISSDSIKQKWMEMSASEDPLRDVEKITFEPDKSSLEAVRAFYNYLKARQLEKAFDLLSENFTEGHGFDYWKQGYETLLDTTVVKIEDDAEIENRVNVKLTTKDFVNDEIVYKYFEGYWDVKEVEGRWLLWDPEIKEIEDPDYFWWYD